MLLVWPSEKAENVSQVADGESWCCGLDKHLWDFWIPPMLKTCIRDL